MSHCLTLNKWEQWSHLAVDKKSKKHATRKNSCASYRAVSIHLRINVNYTGSLRRRNKIRMHYLGKTLCYNLCSSPKLDNYHEVLMAVSLSCAAGLEFNILRSAQSEMYAFFFSFNCVYCISLFWKSYYQHDDVLWLDKCRVI